MIASHHIASENKYRMGRSGIRVGGNMLLHSEHNARAKELDVGMYIGF